MEIEDHILWKETIAFHGHECPGLAIGFRMALQARVLLNWRTRSEDEELVCITECDACGVDAVQFVLGCTFGKGNLIYKPRGKMAMSFYAREAGKNCRFVFNGSELDGLSREERLHRILAAGFDELFLTKPVQDDLPEKARNLKSLPCAQCGELTAEPMMQPFDGKLWCRECRKPCLPSIKC